MTQRINSPFGRAAQLPTPAETTHSDDPLQPATTALSDQRERGPNTRGAVKLAPMPINPPTL